MINDDVMMTKEEFAAKFFPEYDEIRKKLAEKKLMYEFYEKLEKTETTQTEMSKLKQQMFFINKEIARIQEKINDYAYQRIMQITDTDIEQYRSDKLKKIDGEIEALAKNIKKKSDSVANLEKSKIQLASEYVLAEPEKRESIVKKAMNNDKKIAKLKEQIEELIIKQSKVSNERAMVSAKSNNDIKSEFFEKITGCKEFTNYIESATVAVTDTDSFGNKLTISGDTVIAATDAITEVERERHDEELESQPKIELSQPQYEKVITNNNNTEDDELEKISGISVPVSQEFLDEYVPESILSNSPVVSGNIVIAKELLKTVEVYLKTTLDSLNKQLMDMHSALNIDRFSPDFCDWVKAEYVENGVDGLWFKEIRYNKRFLENNANLIEPETIETIDRIVSEYKELVENHPFGIYAGSVRKQAKDLLEQYNLLMLNVYRTIKTVYEQLGFNDYVLSDPTVLSVRLDGHLEELSWRIKVVEEFQKQFQEAVSFSQSKLEEVYMPNIENEEMQDADSSMFDIGDFYEADTEEKQKHI